MMLYTKGSANKKKERSTLLSENGIANSFSSDLKNFCTCTRYKISNWKFDWIAWNEHTEEQSLFPRQQSTLFLRSQEVFK